MMRLKPLCLLSLTSFSISDNIALTISFVITVLIDSTEKFEKLLVHIMKAIQNKVIQRVGGVSINLFYHLRSTFWDEFIRSGL
ncbi:Uncharacterised protein [Lysinibacillus sphaericus]|nr:Uncharacterised protein [Lysinibacillus sphaericus]